MAFRSVRDGVTVVIQVGMRSPGVFVIRTDSIELAADLVQDFCSFAQITELSSTAVFEKEVER